METLWFVAIAFLFGMYFVLEGFDFGVGMLMPVLGRGSDVRRRVVLNTIGPVWDGNEVWLITGVGALFAAFPEWYATMLSGFYPVIVLIVLSLIVRVCAIEYRGKIDDPRWRAWCDRAIGAGSWVPAIGWGIVFANLVRGVAVDADKQMTSSLLDVLNPYALLGGAVFAILFAAHGATFLGLKSAGEVRDDARRIAAGLSISTVVVVGFALWTQLAYGKPWTWVCVAVVVLAVGARAARDWIAFAATTLAIAALVVLLFGSLFPNVMPSTLDPAYSLTVYNAASTPYTLRILAWITVFLAPAVIVYQAWTYWVFRQRISAAHIPPGIGLSLRTGASAPR